jgi:hypothetical protein
MHAHVLVVALSVCFKKADRVRNVLFWTPHLAAATSEPRTDDRESETRGRCHPPVAATDPKSKSIILSAHPFHHQLLGFGRLV